MFVYETKGLTYVFLLTAFVYIISIETPRVQSFKIMVFVYKTQGADLQVFVDGIRVYY